MAGKTGNGQKSKERRRTLPLQAPRVLRVHQRGILKSRRARRMSIEARTTREGGGLFKLELVHGPFGKDA